MAKNKREGSAGQASEVPAVTKDAEFQRYNDLYLDAKRESAIYVADAKAKGVDLLDGEEKSLNRDVEKMRKLLESKDYLAFQHEYQIFNDDIELRRILSGVDRGVKEQEPKTAKVEDAEVTATASAEVKPPLPTTTESADKAVAPKTREQEDQARRDKEFYKCVKAFDLLDRIIHEKDDREKKEGKVIDRYNKPMRYLLYYLGKENDAISPTVFWAAINDFHNVLKTLVAWLPSDLKEAFEREGIFLEKFDIPEVKIEKKPLNAEMQKRLDVIKEKERALKILNEVFEKNFHRATRNYNYDETPTSVLIETSLRYLNDAKESLADQALYGYHIGKSDDKLQELWDTLPAGVPRPKIIKEYKKRLAGEEDSPEIKQKHKEYEEMIDELEQSFSGYRGAMAEADRYNYVKFGPEIGAVYESILHARAALGNHDLYEKKLKAIRSAIANFKKVVDAREDLREKGKEVGEAEKKSIAEELTGGIGSAESAEPAEETPKKKGWWGRFKDSFREKVVKQIFNRETGKLAKKVGYETITSVLGIKLITDAVLWYRKGEGDLADWWKSRKETKEIKLVIAQAYQDLIDAFVKNNHPDQTAEEAQEINDRMTYLRERVESAPISEEEKRALLTKLNEIYQRHTDEIETMTYREMKKEFGSILNASIQAKVSAIKNVQSALNFVLTASGFMMFRATMYAGTSIYRRISQAKKKHARALMTAANPSEVAKLSYAQVMASAAIETVDDLTWGIFDKEKLGLKRRTLNFISSIGTVLRGFGIYGVAVSGLDAPSENIDKMLAAIKEHGGVAGGATVAVSENFIRNLAQVWDNGVRLVHGEFFDHKHSGGSKSAEPHDVLNQPQHFSSADSNLASTPPPVLVGGSHEGIVPTQPPSLIAGHHEAVSSSEPPIVTKPQDVAPTPEPIEFNNHTVAVVEINKGEGILNGVNKVIDNNSSIFVHSNGKAWSASEIHAWKVRELKDMGFKIEGNQWGYPLTVHKGAKIEVYTDDNGQPHFKLAGEEHVTWNKNYKWVESKPVDGNVAEATHDQLLAHETGHVNFENNQADLSGSHTDVAEVGSLGVMAADSHIQTQTATVNSAQEVAHKTVKVDANIKEKAIVQHTEKTAVVPKAASEQAKIVPEQGQETVGHFFAEHGVDPKEFVNTYNKMVDAVVDHFNKHLILTDEAFDILQRKIHALDSNSGITEEALKGGNQIDKGSAEMLEKLLDAEAKFNLKQSAWLETFRGTMFDNNDKFINLAFSADRNVMAVPILTNGGHAAMIWDSTRGKDIFMYDKDSIFSVNSKGELVIEHKNGTNESFTQEEVVRASQGKQVPNKKSK